VIDSIETELDVKKTGNLKFDIVGESTYISNFDILFENPYQTNLFRLNDNFLDGITKFFGNYPLNYKQLTTPTYNQAYNNLKYYRNNQTNNSVLFCLQVDWNNLPDYVLILGNKNKKFRQGSNVLIPEDYKQSKILVSFNVKEFLQSFKKTFEETTINPEVFRITEDFTLSSSDLTLANGIDTKSWKQATMNTGQMDTFESVPVPKVDYSSFVSSNIISKNYFNFEIFFSDDEYELDEIQTSLVSIEEIANFKLDYNWFSTKYGLNLNENNVKDNKDLSVVIANQVDLKVDYAQNEPILDDDLFYGILDRQSNVIPLTEKYFDILSIRNGGLEVGRLFGMSESTSISAIATNTKQFIPSHIVLTIDNLTSNPISSGCYFSIHPGMLNNQIEYRIIARDDLDDKIPYEQRNAKLIFQSTEFEVEDLTGRIGDRKINYQKVRYILHVSVPEYLEVDSGQDIRMYFGGIDITTKIYDVRKNYQTKITTFDLYDFGDLNFSEIVDLNYGLLNFEYKEKDFEYVFFYCYLKPNDLTEEIAKAFNAFGNIFYEAIPYKNNVIIKSTFESEDSKSWNNYKFGYYLRPEVNLGNFKVNSVPLTGLNFYDGNGYVVYTEKINEVNFTEPIFDLNIFYVGQDQIYNLNENSIMKSKFGNSATNMIKVDDSIALPKNINNLENLEENILTILDQNDDINTYQTNYATVTEIFKPVLVRILPIEE